MATSLVLVGIALVFYGALPLTSKLARSPPQRLLDRIDWLRNRAAQIAAVRGRFPSVALKLATLNDAQAVQPSPPRVVSLRISVREGESVLHASLVLPTTAHRPILRSLHDRRARARGQAASGIPRYGFDIGV